MSVTDVQAKEMMDRMRRIETRMTRWLESQGFDTQTKRPTWDDGVVHIPSAACSIKDMLAVVPPTWPVDDVINIQHRGTSVMDVWLPEVLG